MVKRKGEGAGGQPSGTELTPVRGGSGSAAVALERPDTEDERGRWLGLKRCQVGFLREVNRRDSKVYLAVVALSPKARKQTFKPKSRF